MKARSLIKWSTLEEERRRRESGGLQALPGVLVSLVLGGLLAAEVTRRLASADAAELYGAAVSASHLWFAAAVTGFSISIFGAPFRLYWRRDSKILASLPVPGQSLFALALWRSQRSAALVALALLAALLPLGHWTDWEVAYRHLLPLAIGFAGAAWLGPAAALSAGAIVASDKAQALIASMGGEFQAPRTSWLGLLPGLAATAVALTLIASAPWVVGSRPPGGSIALIAGLGLSLPLVSLAWAWTRAQAVIPAAVREVAALDQEILAHVERSTPSALERFVAGLFGGPAGRRVALKDASLMRRRYPSPYFAIPLGILAIWIVCLSQPENYLPWGASLYGAILTYAILLARRAEVEPIEIPRLLASLPISPANVSSAKRGQALLRITFITVVAGVPLLLRAPQLLGAAVLIAGTSLLSAAACWRRA